MSNGLGAGFAGLTLMAVLLGLAAILTLSLVGVFLFQRRNGSVPNLLKYLSVSVLLGVVLVAGFAVAALYDEAARLTAVFFVVVWMPLIAVAFYLNRSTELHWLDTVAVTGLAWSLPFIVGVFVVFGLTIGVSQVLGWTSVQSQQMGLTTIATIVGGIVVMAGAIFLGKRVSVRFSS